MNKLQKSYKKHLLVQLFGLPNFLSCVLGYTTAFWITFPIACANVLAAAFFYYLWWKNNQDTDERK